MDFFRANQPVIDSELHTYFDKELHSEPIPSFEKEIFKHIAEFTLRGGKRIRASLVQVGYMLFQSEVSSDMLEVIHRLGISMELLQSYFLVHDDIMDSASTRRGLPTLHLKWADEYSNNLHIGESFALLAGNLAVTKAYQVLQELPYINLEVKLNLLALCHKIIENTLAGQILDLKVGLQDLDTTSEQDIIEVMRLKTAKYTILGPLQFGALLANVQQTEIDKMSEFGIPMGLAFQISDDILGTFGDADTTGKSNNSDLQEGKKTFFVLDAYKKANANDKKILRETLGKTNLSVESYDQVREIIIKYGSLEYAQEMIKRYIDQSLDALRQFSGESDSKEVLHNLALNQLSRKF